MTKDKQIRKMLEDPSYLIWDFLQAFEYAEPHLAHGVKSERLKLEYMKKKLEEVL